MYSPSLSILHVSGKVSLCKVVVNWKFRGGADTHRDLRNGFEIDLIVYSCVGDSLAEALKSVLANVLFFLECLAHSH